MRNLNKWVKENKGTIVEKSNGYVQYEVKGIKFTVSRKESDAYTSWDGRNYGSSAGYKLRVHGVRNSNDYKTQKEIITHVESLIKKADKEIEEIEALNETEENIYVEQLAGEEYRVKNIESGKSVIVEKDNEIYVVAYEKEFENIGDVIDCVLSELEISHSDNEEIETVESIENEKELFNKRINFSAKIQDEMISRNIYKDYYSPTRLEKIVMNLSNENNYDVDEAIEIMTYKMWDKVTDDFDRIGWEKYSAYAVLNMTSDKEMTYKQLESNIKKWFSIE